MHLKELEEYGILYKEVYAESPARVEYKFTDIGESLLPVLATLETWGNLNKEHIQRNIDTYQPGTCRFLPQ